MASRVHDYPEQFDAGLKPKLVTEKYYYVRHPDITRVVDISGVVEKKIDANIANVAKGPGGHHGSALRAELAKQGKRLPLLGDDDRTADRNYIKEFVMARDRTLARNTASSTPRDSITSRRLAGPASTITSNRTPSRFGNYPLSANVARTLCLPRRDSSRCPAL
jgi:hypothetical protein